jgi:hypothetical protein
MTNIIRARPYLETHLHVGVIESTPVVKMPDSIIYRGRYSVHDPMLHRCNFLFNNMNMFNRYKCPIVFKISHIHVLYARI